MTAALRDGPGLHGPAPSLSLQQAPHSYREVSLEEVRGRPRLPEAFIGWATLSHGAHSPALLGRR
jgi:hypothetical protein